MAPREYYEGMINYCMVTGEAYPYHLSDAILSPDNPGCHPVEFHRRIAVSLLRGKQPNYMSTYACMDSHNHTGLGRNTLERLERFRPDLKSKSILAWRSRNELKTKATETADYQLQNHVLPRNVLPNAERGIYSVKAFRPSEEDVKKLSPPLYATLNAVMDEEPEKGKPLLELDAVACTNLYLQGLVYFEVDLPRTLRLRSTEAPGGMANVVQRSGRGRVERLAVDARTLCGRKGATAESISSALEVPLGDALDAFRLLFRLGLFVVDSTETGDEKTEASRSTPVLVIQDYLTGILLAWPRDLGDVLNPRTLELRETGITRNADLGEAIENACYDIRTEEAVARTVVSREEIDDPIFYWREVVSSLGTLVSSLRTSCPSESPIIALQESASQRDSHRRSEVLQKLLRECGPCIFVEPAEPIPRPLEVLASACLPTSRACMEGWCTLFLCRLVGSSAPTALLPDTGHFKSWIGGFGGRLRSCLRVLFSFWSTGEHYMGTLENVMCETEIFLRGPVVARILPPGNVPSQTSLSFLNLCVQPVLVEDCECMYVVFPTEKYSDPGSSRFYSKGIPGEIDNSKPVPLAQAEKAGLVTSEDVQTLDDMLTGLLSNYGCFGFFYATLRIVRFSFGGALTEEEEETREQIEPRSGGWGVWDVRWGASLNPVLASSMMECEVALKLSYRNMFSQNNTMWCKRLEDFVLQMRTDEESLRARCGLGRGPGVKKPVLRNQWADVSLAEEEDGASEAVKARTEDGETGSMPHGPPVCIHAVP